MAILNAHDREIEAKLVYYGTALGGKTTNLRVLHRLAEPEQGQRLVSLNTAGDRTLFFDLLPFDLGRVLDWQVRLKLYSIPGQPEYSETRRVVLKASDAIVFVADSSPGRRDENRQAVDFLKTNLKQNQIDAERVPLVFQWNKRDLAGAIPEAELERALNWRKAPAASATAVSGEGVLETFELAVVGMLRVLLERYSPRGRAVPSAAEIGAIVSQRLAPLHARAREYQSRRSELEQRSPRHIVVRSTAEPDPVVPGPASSGAPAEAAGIPAAPSRLEAALDIEIRLLNEIMDREAVAHAGVAGTVNDLGAADTVNDFGAGIEPGAAVLSGPGRSAGFDPERLRAALAESSAGPTLGDAAAPLLRLACELSGADGGSVLVMAVGPGPLSQAAILGIAREPLNRASPAGATPPARALALGSVALWGDELRRLAGDERATLQVGRVPIAALPLIAGRRRVGLLVLHGSAGTVLDQPVRAALELLAATLALELTVRGLERRLGPAVGSRPVVPEVGAEGARILTPVGD